MAQLLQTQLILAFPFCSDPKIEILRIKNKKNSRTYYDALTSGFGTMFSLAFPINWVHRQHRCDRQPISIFGNEIFVPKMLAVNGWMLCGVFAAFDPPSACENHFYSDYVHLWSFRCHHGTAFHWYRYNSAQTIVNGNRCNPNPMTNALRCRYWYFRPDHRCFGDLAVCSVNFRRWKVELNSENTKKTAINTTDKIIAAEITALQNVCTSDCWAQLGEREE